MDQPNKDHEFIESEITKLIERISEHCESITVFATTPSGGSNTDSIVIGHGNWYAQYGHVRTWIKKLDERDRLRTKKEFDETPE